ncbi:MAG: cytochrome C [Desulfobacterales bacterium]
MRTIRYIQRFSKTERLFHLFLMLTFLFQTVTGFGRLYGLTPFGSAVIKLFGGFETTALLHQAAGILMTAGFLLHVGFLLAKIKPGIIREILTGPDSIVPNMKDARDMRQNLLHLFGKAPAPRFERWTYWEKFDYWAVFWGMPLLVITGFMLIFPLHVSRVLPGWTLNIAGYLHRAEAVLAVSYIFIVHFFIGHLRPMTFPMNEAMFSGNVEIEEVELEKPEWVDRLSREGRLTHLSARQPSSWFRAVYLIYGFAAVGLGVYLLVNGIYFNSHIRLH